jgi:hypothetical protein
MRARRRLGHTVQPLVLTLAATCMVAGGCWADFPESRYLQDARQPDSRQPDSRQPDSRQPDSQPDLGPLDHGADLLPADGPQPDLGPREAGPDQAGDQRLPDTLAPDLPRPDALTPDLPAPDTLALDLPSPDTLAPDTLVPDTLGPDAFSCTPNTFVDCSGKLLRYCNAIGDGLVSTNCASSSCSTALQRCDQCDPSSTAPSCQGADLRTCSAKGLFETSTCLLGCLAGACCTDGDNDGAACTDCDDTDGDAFPGQSSYFDVPRQSGGYDYNCINGEEQEFPDLVQCVGSGANCSGDGWIGAVPACGQSGQYATCTKVTGSCVQQPPTTQTQTCR